MSWVTLADTQYGVTHDVDTVSELHFQARSKEEKACKCDFDLISMLFLERLERTQRMVFIRS